VLVVSAALAFLSHVGVFPVLFVKLFLAGVLLWLIGEGIARRAGPSAIAAAVLAAVLSTVVYYGHFPEVYRSLDRVLGRATAAAPISELDADTAASASETAAPVRGLRPPTLLGRIRGDLIHLVNNVGWPIFSLAALGLWPAMTRHRRDYLTIVLFAWLATHAMFMAFTAAAPVEPRFQRYTTNFVGRLNYSTGPAAVILAAYGARWLWSSGLVARAATIALVGAAAITALRVWVASFQ
jgi:hypothetical protein